jgi:hypothetical protein
MFNARNIFRDRVVLTLAAAMLFAAAAKGQPLQPLPRGPLAQGPLARLVKTPDGSAGLPPFALADQSGTIQRYVEPVPGIDLVPYIDQIVSVRHDTGQILLASQLELPAKPLYPMIGGSGAYDSTYTGGHTTAVARGELRSDHLVQQAQYADRDDATVELLDEGEGFSGANGPRFHGPMSEGAIYSDGGYPPFPGGMPPPGMATMGANPVYCDPMYCGPQGYGSFPADYGMNPNPQYGGYPGPDDYYAQGPGFVQPFAQPERERPHFYADVEINFLRAHLMEEQFGKLSEKYEFSPRFIVGFSGVGNLNGRVRYWLYGRETRILDGDSIRLEFDVLDVEATHHFVGRRSEIVLAAGLRLANIELEFNDVAEAGTDLIGITFAADGRTPLISLEGGRLGWVYGGRLSILGGDWSGDIDDGLGLGDWRIRDDNVVVHELYAGIEYTCCYRSAELHARLAFEMQNWHSDALSQITTADSIGFVGPGIRVGAEF